ncbi:sugar phosphate isomerase/epimerase family protein [Enterococcus sp. AZ163]|uniref:sugar phosphate isomerase/epimerase family protein n=1 Tax=Enterococcus sp. AZ163 TaxID=2774638 RepID=UPI003D2A2B2E
MKREQIVLNLLVFAKEAEAGALQAELLMKAKELGFNKVELRREYFQNIKEEIPVIKKLAEKNDIELFYSVPDEVFVNREINPNLTKYLMEVKELGVKHIKWNIGDFHKDIELANLQALTEEGVEVNVENDQTQTSGTIQAILTFMEAVNIARLAIGYVYDLGNWRFVGESEEVAAEKLSAYVRYIHVKNVAYENNQPQAAELDKGVIKWRKILEILPQNIPVAIEYPTTSDKQILTAKQLLEEA